MAAALARRPLVFTGFMGAGKSRAAALAAEALGIAALDTDRVLVEKTGRTVAELFATRGEAAFRALEEQTVLAALEAGHAAVALGGGALGSARVREALGDATVVWLDVSEPVAWGRVERSDRPLAGDRERFSRLHAERQPVYERAADAVVANDDPDAVRRALPALLELAQAPPGTRLAWATSASGDYPVLLRRGLLDDVDWPLEGRRFLVTDGAVGRLYAGRVEPLAATVAIMPGEQSKTIAHAEIVWTELVRHGMTRADHVVALGGGVVGDLAGFCAATYQRGVPVVQVPTTLVAQVDSAYGGKTGVDLPDAKNYVGAFHQPRAVLVDTATLDTLPAGERAAGLAEVVKTALIAGGPLWDSVRSGLGGWAMVPDEVIFACARAKLAVVAADERDGGRRQVLNLGHTIGHAIETATGYGLYRHGEAVALGLLAALRLSERPDLRDEVGDLLAEAGLPTGLGPGVDVDAVLGAVRRDKKRLGEGPVPFVLVDAPGTVHHGVAVAPDAVRAAVQELAPR